MKGKTHSIITTVFSHKNLKHRETLNFHIFIALYFVYYRSMYETISRLHYMYQTSIKVTQYS